MDIRKYRSWMYNRMLPSKKDFTQEFVVGVYHFIEYVKTTALFQIENETRCPCRKCVNRKYLKIDNVHEHILRNGFVADYYYWTSHGEEWQQDFGIPNRVASTLASSSNESVSYVKTHEHPGDEAASSEAPPPLQVQIDRWAEMEGDKKKDRVFGLTGLASQVSGSPSSRGLTQREQMLQTELSTVIYELTQVKQQMSSLQQTNEEKTAAFEEQMRAQIQQVEEMRTQMAAFEQMRAQMSAFEETRAQMAAFMSMSQPHFGPSASFSSRSSSLSFPSTVAPRPRGTFISSTPFRPPHAPADDEPADSDAE